MKKIAQMFVATAVLSIPALMTSATRAEATEYPYCLSYVEGWGGYVERCDYSTMDQCRMSAQGLNGSCDPNRRYTQALPVERPIRQRYPQRAY
jgi:hypothetical protein